MISAPDLSGGDSLSSEDGSEGSDEDDNNPADLAAALQSKILKNLFLQVCCFFCIQISRLLLL